MQIDNQLHKSISKSEIDCNSHSSEFRIIRYHFLHYHVKRFFSFRDEFQVFLCLKS